MEKKGGINSNINKYLIRRYKKYKSGARLMELFQNVLPKDFDFKKDLITTFLCKYGSNKKKLLVSSSSLPIKHLEEVKVNLDRKLDLPIDTFELENEIDDKVYKFQDMENLNAYNEILTYFDIPNNLVSKQEQITIGVADKLPPAKDLNFLIHHFETNKDKILIFTRQDRISLSSKKTIFKMVNNSDFTVVDDKDFYMFNPLITCMFINEKLFVFDYKGFIEIFNYKQHLKNHVSSVITLLESSGIIDNISDYKEEVNHFRNFNALTKVKNDDKQIKKFINHHNKKIVAITKDYDVKFKFNPKTNSFSVDDEIGLKLIIRILSDRAGFDFGESLITYASKKSIKRNII